jgi:putative DNA primase/helicase
MPAKMTLGKIGGGAVRLHEPDVDLGAIGITEGIETALSVAQAINMPVWAALSAGGIEKLKLPAAAQDVVIFADRDSHGRGQQAAEQAADRFTGEGRRVRIILPPTVGIDFNDMIAEGSG